MAMFYEDKSASESELTAENAQIIYDYFTANPCCGPSQMFENIGYPVPHGQQVKDEYKRLQSEIISKVSGTWLLEAAILDSETGEVVTPAVYYTVTTKTALADSLSSELLDEEDVLDDCIAWNPNKDSERTWTQFKTYYGSLSE